MPEWLIQLADKGVGFAVAVLIIGSLYRLFDKHIGPVVGSVVIIVRTFLDGMLATNTAINSSMQQHMREDADRHERMMKAYDDGQTNTRNDLRNALTMATAALDISITEVREIANDTQAQVLDMKGRLFPDRSLSPSGGMPVVRRKLPIARTEEDPPPGQMPPRRPVIR